MNVTAIMAEIIGQKLRHHPKDDDDDLAKLGFDSQALLDLILEVEDRTGLQYDGTLYNFENGVHWRKMALAFV